VAEHVDVSIIRLDPEVPLPAYARPGDAGADLVTTVDVRLDAKYAVVVTDVERPPELPNGRMDSLIALTQSLNATTRGSLCTLRAGGNRNGHDTALTWQTGFPMAVDFSRGAPRYHPEDAALPRLARGAFDVALIVGGMDRALNYAQVDDYLRSGARRVTLIQAPTNGTAIGVGYAAEHPAEVHVVDSLEDAVRTAAELAGVDVVLLSPGAASYDLFPNYKAKAAAYCGFIDGLPGAVGDRH